MSVDLKSPRGSNPATPKRQRRRSVAQPFAAANSLLAQGESMIWLTGGALVLSLCMIFGLIVLVIVRGGATFWPQPVTRIDTLKGQSLLGEIIREESYQPTRQNLADELPADQLAAIEANVAAEPVRRRLLQTTKFEGDLTSNVWVSDFAVQQETQPEWSVLFERLEQGRLYGQPVGYVLNQETVTTPSASAAWEFFNEHHALVRQRLVQRKSLERVTLGRINARIEAARVAERQAILQHGVSSPAALAEKTRQAEIIQACQQESQAVLEQIKTLKEENAKYQLLVESSNQKQVTVPLEEIVRAFPVNRLSFSQKLGVYTARWWEFLTAEPRASNTEGGVMPAIFGTVVMTLIMSIAVAPFGVLAALYLREYAKAGFIVSLVRIAINNLSGVPSIVFGVFGFGFFCCQVGAFIDGGPKHAQFPVMPPAAWYLGCFSLALLGLAAFICGMLGPSARAGEASPAQRWLGRSAVVLWLSSTGLLVFLIATSPFFSGFFAATLPTPTFGTGGVFWSALTLSLLTLPVVIVATEEALFAVPNSLREGSYACGAGKWQTIRRIVLPHAMPGIMTGMILAMSRGAGEVAPLMLVGAIKFAPKLPLDTEFPFVHPERSFMHLAFHIFDLGFHSPDSEAAKPTVYTTILLLIAIVATLNLAAVWLRARLRKAFQSGQF
jgi:ABC-type phosphate transport system permease subunit